MRATLAASMLAALASLSSAAPAPKTAGLQSVVNISVHHVPLGIFLDALSSQAGVSFVVSDALEDKPVTAFLHDVSVAQALDVIRELKGVDYRLIGNTNTYVVLPKDSPRLLVPAVLDAGPKLDKRVKIIVKKATLGKFLDKLAESTRASFTLEEGLEAGKVTVYMKDVTAREALEVVLTVKGLSCRRLGETDTYLISRAPIPSSSDDE